MKQRMYLQCNMWIDKVLFIFLRFFLETDFSLLKFKLVQKMGKYSGKGELEPICLGKNIEVNKILWFGWGIPKRVLNNVTVV